MICLGLNSWQSMRMGLQQENSIGNCHRTSCLIKMCCLGANKFSENDWMIRPGPYRPNHYKHDLSAHWIITACSGTCGKAVYYHHWHTLAAYWIITAAELVARPSNVKQLQLLGMAAKYFCPVFLLHILKSLISCISSVVWLCTGESLRV